MARRVNKPPSCPLDEYDEAILHTKVKLRKLAIASRVLTEPMENSTRHFEGIREVRSKTWLCPCGTGHEFQVFWGSLRYSPDYEVKFVAAHLEHSDSGPHVWFLLGSGPWVQGDDRNCWVTMHLYLDDQENVITRIEDPEESPLWSSRNLEYRYLTREEVLAQNGAKEWAIGRRLDFEYHHLPTKQFLRQ